MFDNTKSLKDIHEYFLSHKDELASLKKEVEERYNQSYSHMNEEEFVNWYFAIYNFYKLNAFIKVSQELTEIVNSKVIYMNNEPYVPIKYFIDNESNLKLSTVTIGNLSKQFLTEQEAEEEIKNLKDTVTVLNDYHKRNQHLYRETKKLETKDNFYGNYKENGKEYCSFRLWEVPSNLDLWTIMLSGNDDYSISKDFLSREEAFKEKAYLESLDYIEKDLLKDYYFSN